MYKFALNINDEKQGLNPENGLAYGDLGLLINHLDKAINPKDGKKCTLYEISNHGYTPHFNTESKDLYTNFIEVHKNIYEKGINDLKKEEATYANTLKRVLSKDKYVEPLDNDSQPILRILGSEIERGVDTYNVVTNQSGVISEIGSPKLDDTRHIYLHDVDYKIFISNAQEDLLKQYYRNGVLDLKIKQRRSIKTGRVINALLISIKIKQNLTLSESLSTLTNEDLSLFGNINNHEDILTLLRS
jgi:hypothetical protein